MPFEVNIIQALQRLSSPFFDALNIILTQAGDELFFMVVAVLFYWCLDKRFGFKLINVYLLSVSVNEGLKALIRRPRPYTLDSVRSIGEKTSGFSFPSGHSQSISNIGTQIVIRHKNKRKYFIIGAAIMTAIVMFTRMYLGQHYLTDVLTGAVAGIACAIGFHYLFELLGNREENVVFAVLPICLVVMLVMLIIPSIASQDVLKVAGGYAAVSLGYFIEKKYVRYEVKSNKWWKHLLKVLFGLVVALLLKEGLKILLRGQTAVLYSFVRYFIVGIWASLLSMMCFKALKL